jgi:hypothetical protein
MAEGETDIEPSIFDPILIRYDGLDATQHEIEISALGESLRGLSRVIGVAANFAATQRYVQHKDALSVRVVARRSCAACRGHAFRPPRRWRRPDDRAPQIRGVVDAEGYRVDSTGRRVPVQNQYYSLVGQASSSQVVLRDEYGNRYDSRGNRI